MSGRHDPKPHHDTGFLEYKTKVMRLYGEQKYGQALSAAEEAARLFPEYAAKASFWMACLQCRTNDFDTALATLQKAVRRGIWWTVNVLLDHDLDPIRDKPEFRALESEVHRLEQTQARQSEPELMVRTPTNYRSDKQWPALVMLHQRYGERPELSVDRWDSVLSYGMMLAAPWSSQVYAWDGRCWDDLELAEKDVKWTLGELENTHSVDKNRVVLGGFSQGAALSIHCVLNRLVPCRGFVAVAPSDWVVPERPANERDQPSERFASMVQSADCRGLRGVIIIGDKDAFYSKIMKLQSIMVEKGLSLKLVVKPGLGHEYSSDFESKLREALEFLMGKEIRDWASASH